LKNKRKILITGADGFVGAHLCEALKNEYDIIRLTTPGRESTAANTFSVDLTSGESTSSFAEKLIGEPLHSVVHLAFILCEPGDWDNFIYLHKNNQITENMIELLRSIKCDNLLNFSSLAVYPNKDGLYTEDSPVDPSPNTECLYGLAKFNSEVLFNRFLGDRLNVVNFRMCQVYGPDMQEDRLVGMFRKELREKNTITVFGNGDRISNFIHIEDVAQAVCRVLENPIPGIFNLGCHKNVSYLDLAEKIVQEHGDKDSRVLLRENGQKAKAAIDVSKFETTFSVRCDREKYC